MSIVTSGRYNAAKTNAIPFLLGAAVFSSELSLLSEY
jgi:hypothetical protein